MPKSPHSSWNLSRRSRAGSADMSLKAGPPGQGAPTQREVDHAGTAHLDHQPIATYPSDPSPRRSKLSHELLEMAFRSRPHAHHDARRSFAEQQERQRRSRG